MTKVNYDSIIALTAETILSARDKGKIDELDCIIQQDPSNLSAYMQKGFLLFQAQADGQAIKVFNEVLERDPHYVDAYVWLAELLLFHWADAESAIFLLVKAKRIAPQRADVYYLLAVAFKKQNDVSQFICCMQKAIELEPTWPNPHICLIEHFVAEGKNDLAKQELQELEKHMQVNFPVPDDEMKLYYEELVTGRVMTDYAREQLQKLKSYVFAIFQKKQ
jgi:tetratricopeptide (TPR) repeat protein